MGGKSGFSLKTALVTGAAFTGYNIGSGFAAGVEPMQFFASWGAGRGFLSIIVACVFLMAGLCVIYVGGQGKEFSEDREIYRYFGGRLFGTFVDYYVYFMLVLVTFTMISGAGATLNQYWGMPPYIGAAVIGAACVITSMLDLTRMRGLMSYLCVFVVALIAVCLAIAAARNDTGPFAGSVNADSYAASGSIMRISIFGIEDPLLSGLCSGGLMLSSGFAWAAATGRLCSSKKEALLSGVFSSVFYYAASAIVVCLMLMNMDRIAGDEVPMLSVITEYMPVIGSVYSFILCFAIYTSISGRLFLIGERFGGGSRKKTLAIVTVITAAAVICSLFVPFSRISNFMFSVCGTVGIVLTIVILVRTAMGKNGK